MLRGALRVGRRVGRQEAASLPSRRPSASVSRARRQATRASSAVGNLPCHARTRSLGSRLPAADQKNDLSRPRRSRLAAWPYRRSGGFLSRSRRRDAGWPQRWPTRGVAPVHAHEDHAGRPPQAVREGERLTHEAAARLRKAAEVVVTKLRKWLEKTVRHCHRHRLLPVPATNPTPHLTTARPLCAAACTMVWRRS